MGPNLVQLGSDCGKVSFKALSVRSQSQACSNPHPRHHPGVFNGNARAKLRSKLFSIAAPQLYDLG